MQGEWENLSLNRGLAALTSDHTGGGDFHQPQFFKLYVIFTVNLQREAYRRKNLLLCNVKHSFLNTVLYH